MPSTNYQDNVNKLKVFSLWVPVVGWLILLIYTWTYGYYDKPQVCYPSGVTLPLDVVIQTVSAIALAGYSLCWTIEILIFFGVWKNAFDVLGGSLCSPYTIVVIVSRALTVILTAVVAYSVNTYPEACYNLQYQAFQVGAAQLFALTFAFGATAWASCLGWAN